MASVPATMTTEERRNGTRRPFWDLSGGVLEVVIADLMLQSRSR